MATFSNIPSGHKDLLSKSFTIREGRPKIYQFKPTKEMSSTVTRMTVGERNLGKPNKTVLLVGETGTGKSLLINALFNHMMGVTWEDEVWFQLVEEEKQSSNQSVSQTPDVMVYQIFGFCGNAPPYSLTIIDTPGFGDTRGIEHDTMITERLLDVFRSEDGVRSIHAVGLVVKSSDNRLSDRLLYIFNSVMSLFGKDMEKNIVALVTHSDGVTPQNVLNALEAANIKCVTNKENQPTHFLFNNQQKTERTEENKSSLENAWKISQKGMKKFTAFLDEITPQELEETVKVLNERVRLTACIQNLQVRIEMIDLKKQEIQQKQEAVREYEEETKKSKSFKKTVDVPYKDKENISDGGWGFFKYSGAVCCTTCEETCHFPGCTVAWTPAWCEVMKDDHCTVCSGKCPVSCHVKDKWRYVNKTRKVEYTNEDMKKEYEKNKSAGSKEKSLLEMQRDEERKMMEEKRKLLDEAYQHVISLDQIALNVDSVSTFVHYDFLINEMSERGEKEKVQKLEEMKRRMDEGTKSAAAYVWNKLQGVKNWLKGKELSFSNIPPRHQDLLSRSVTIREGRPKIYQFKPTKEMSSTVTRMTVGERNLGKPNKTVLLVGETGTGKSLLINALFNHMMGVTWEDEVWFQLVEEENSSNQSVSQTPDVMVYQIFGFCGNAPPYSLTIIDTPGFGHTSGVEHDTMITDRLLDVFRSEDGVRSIHAVGLVVKSSDNRLSDRLLSAFNSVMSLFGKDMEKNIVALVTHSDGVTPQNVLKTLEAANIKCGKNKKNQPTHFLFNNQQKTERTEENKSSLENAWKITDRGIKQFTAFLDEITPQELDETVQVMNERVHLTACIQNLQVRIEMIDLKKQEIQQKQEAVREYEEETKKNKSFKKTVDVPYKDKENISDGGWGFFKYSGAVCCTTCEETCHYPCTVTWTAEQCEMMKDGNCTVCSGKCPVSCHVKDKWRYVNKTRKTEYTNEDMKKEYEKNKSAGSKEKSLLEMQRDEERKMMEEKRKLLDEAYQHVISLDQIALNVDSVSTFVHYDFLINEMSERGEKEKVQKLEEMKRRMDEGTKSAAAYVRNKLQGVKNWLKK